MQQSHIEPEDLVTAYMGRLTQAPLLSQEEEQRLTIANRDGDPEARRRLIESNMRLVINIAKAYRSRSVPIEDLIQEGAIGLMQAVERFDPDKGFRFSTYASHWVRQAIGRALDNKAKAIRLPAHVIQSLRRIEKTRLLLAKELGHDPTHEELAEAVGLHPKKLEGLQKSTQEMLSLDMKFGEGENTALINLLPDATCIDATTGLLNEERTLELDSILNELSEREQKIVSRRFRQEDGDDISAMRDELARELHLSKERIRQIEISAIKRLRHMARQRKFSETIGQ